MAPAIDLHRKSTATGAAAGGLPMAGQDGGGVPARLA